MESDLTVFLEFYGIPGCGKSTVSHILAQELCKTGKRVSEPTYDLDHNRATGCRKWIKLFALVQLAVFHPQKNIALRKLVRDCGYMGRKALPHMVNIAKKLSVYSSAKADYVVFDEGLTQSAISLAQSGTEDCKMIEKRLYELCDRSKIQKIYIKADPDTALIRIMNREKHDSRIEKLQSESEKAQALVSFEATCNKMDPDFVIDESDASKAAKQLLQQII